MQQMGSEDHVHVQTCDLSMLSDDDWQKVSDKLLESQYSMVKAFNIIDVALHRESEGAT